MAVRRKMSYARINEPYTADKPQPFFVGEKVIVVNAHPKASFKNGEILEVDSCRISEVKGNTYWYVGVKGHHDSLRPTLFASIESPFINPWKMSTEEFIKLLIEEETNHKKAGWKRNGSDTDWVWYDPVSSKKPERIKIKEDKIIWFKDSIEAELTFDEFLDNR